LRPIFSLHPKIAMCQIQPRRVALATSTCHIGTHGAGITGSLMLKLVLNDPPDFDRLGALLFDKHDLLLVWPEARFPFDREQWRERLSLHPGNQSYFVALDGPTIGHVALLETDEARTFAVSYVFIKPQYRGRGLGMQLMTLVELEAKKLGARALRLRVRTYNPRARRVYEAAGFAQSDQTDTLVIMRKRL
jgi:RimJ/RimL family protein N-acetyltransferase